MDSGTDLQTYLDNLSDDLQAHWNEMLTKDALYPLGSIFHSTSDTSPASLFGGSWEKIYDRFLIGAGGTYAVNDMGGEATHTLTLAESPDHTHPLAVGQGGGAGTFPAWAYTNASGGPSHGFTANYALTGYTGAKPHTTEPHNNIPPYYAVNIWRRTA